MTVLVIDSNIRLCGMLRQYFQKEWNFAAVHMAHDGIRGLDIIRSEQPDLLMLDLALPHLDGLGVLEQLADVPAPGPGQIMLTTAFNRSRIIRRAVTLGVDEVLLKPFSFQELSRSLVKLMAQKNGKTVQQSSSSLQHVLVEVLVGIGIPSHFRGFFYLQEAVLLAVDRGWTVDALTTEIFPSLAADFNSTPSAVEAAVRHALLYAWEHGNVSYMRSVCGQQGNSWVPTNARFIACLLQYLRNRRGEVSGQFAADQAVDKPEQAGYTRS